MEYHSKKIKAEYIWIDASGNPRSKTKILDYDYDSPIALHFFPIWNFDGSSTGQANTDDSEVLLKPVRIYKDPFTKHHNVLILCETLNHDNTPHSTNTRRVAFDIFDKYNSRLLKPWFGIEQEFFLLEPDLSTPYKYNHLTFDSNFQQGEFYCSVGHNNARARDFLTDVENYCLYTNIGITGKNFEVAPSQMEVQVMNQDIKAADDIVILRYILHRLSEKYKSVVDLSARPIDGNINASGCHVNFSTEPMRNNGGYKIIVDAVHKLSLKHKEHIDIYGSDNHTRLTGNFETSSIDTFTSGVADRTASIRIPRNTLTYGKGYFEDRRPSSSCDPYLVTSKIFETCCQ